MIEQNRAHTKKYDQSNTLERSISEVLIKQLNMIYFLDWFSMGKSLIIVQWSDPKSKNTVIYRDIEYIAIQDS